MSLTLITGPANAGKASVVLGRVRTEAERGEPILVVPTRVDVESYRRELAADGVVFGARVERFAGLVREIARRVDVGGCPARRAGPRAGRRLGRRRGDAARVRARRRPPRGSRARSPGSSPSCGPGASRPGAGARRCGRGRRSDGAGREGYAEDLATIYSGYDALLRRLGRPDRETPRHHGPRRARPRPGALGRDAGPLLRLRRPDADRAGRDRDARAGRRRPGDRLARVRAGSARLRRAGDDLPDARSPGRRAHRAAGPGRALRAGRARRAAPSRAFAVRGGRGARRPGHGGPAARGRRRARRAPARRRRDPRAARRRRRARGDRRRAARGRAAAPLLDEVFTAAAIPYTMQRRVRFADTGVGRGLCALLRCAADDAAGDALLTWLRASSRPREAELVDALEARARAAGVSSVSGLRALWEPEHGPLPSLDRLAAAAQRGPGALLARSGAELDRLFSAPWRRRAHVLGGEDVLAAKAVAAARRALDELRECVRATRELVVDLPDAARGARDPRGRRRRAARTGRGRDRGPARAAGPARARAVRVRTAGGVFPAPTASRSVPRRGGPARARARLRGPSRGRRRRRRRALPAVRLRLAPGGAALPQLAHRRRRRRAGGALVVPRRPARAVHRRAVGPASSPRPRRRRLARPRRPADAGVRARRPRRARPAATSRRWRRWATPLCSAPWRRLRGRRRASRSGSPAR